MSNNTQKTLNNTQKTIHTTKAQHPRPLVTVHFVSSNGKIADKAKIPSDILAQYPYFVKAEKGYYQIKDGDDLMIDKNASFQNKYFTHIKNKDAMKEDSEVVAFGVKDGMTRIGYKRDVEKGQYQKEFIKAVNPKTAEYITVYSQDLNDIQKWKMRRRTTINKDPMHPSNRRSVEVSNDDFQKLWDKCSEVDVAKLQNLSQKQTVVLEGKNSFLPPIVNLSNFNTFNSIQKPKVSFLPQIAKPSPKKAKEPFKTLPPITGKAKKPEIAR